MIRMVEYKEIIRLRNIGMSQKAISSQLGISRRTVGRYLRSGEIPHYRRCSTTKVDPFVGFEEVVKDHLDKKPDIDMHFIFSTVQALGYQGSYRTLCRKTEILRQQIKNKPLYFERSKIPGRIMEGDFTELGGIDIGGKEQVVHLWVVVLPYSNKLFATPYFQETFECFASGSVEAFEEFRGTAEIYRLDNLTPVVSKILKGSRKITDNFKTFQKHYGFKTHFCNPASGWEKGSVESNNGHLKRRLETEIAINNLSFTSLDAFRELVQSVCRKLNESESVAQAFKEEHLCALPADSYEAYQTEVSKVSKYSTVSVGIEGHRYSVPSTYVGCRVETRLYPNKVIMLCSGNVIATHRRIFSGENKASIHLEHVIKELCKKPGVILEWKHKDILFAHPVWNVFYERMKTQRDEISSMKEFLRCLSLVTEYGRQNVTVAMELLEQQGGLLTCEKLESIVTNEIFDPMDIRPNRRNLVEYDELLRRAV